MSTDDQVELVEKIVRTRHAQVVIVSLLVVIVLAVVVLVSINDSYARIDATRERHAITCEILANRGEEDAIAGHLGLTSLPVVPSASYCAPPAPKAGRR